MLIKNDYPEDFIHVLEVAYGNISMEIITHVLTL